MTIITMPVTITKKIAEPDAAHHRLEAREDPSEGAEAAEDDQDDVEERGSASGRRGSRT